VIDPVVRRASDDDHLALSDLARSARHDLADVRGGRRWLETHPEPVWSASELVVLVAELDALVVGYLAARRTESEVMRVDEVYVHPDCRELGFGDRLVECALDEARALGCSTFEAEALPGDRATKNLWERAGITARLITVSTDL